jgi:hypothetical protein
MADMFREVSSQGWLSRIGSSIKGVLIGGILAIICVVALFWNEGRAVNDFKRIAEGQAACISVDSAKVDPANEMKEVHISGDAVTTEKPADDVFGVSAPAIRLKRFVEMYQWKEKKETSKQTKLGGGEETTTTYNYSKAWDDDINDSSDFKHPEGHENPNHKPYESATIDAANVNVGAFKLSEKLIDLMDNFEPLAINEQSATLPTSLASTVKIDGGGFYVGSDPQTPHVGDTRIHFLVVKPGPVSVVGQQVGGTFQPFTSAHGTTLLLESSIKSADEMFATEKKRAEMITWVIRLGGFVLMWIGLMMLVRPLRVVADILPFAGSMVEFASGLVMLLVAGTVSLVTIAIAWLVYRPVLGIALLILAAGLVVLIVKKKKAHTATLPAIPRATTFPPPPIPS